jgi:hypothetical protein
VAAFLGAVAAIGAYFGMDHSDDGKVNNSPASNLSSAIVNTVNSNGGSSSGKDKKSNTNGTLAVAGSPDPDDKGKKEENSNQKTKKQEVDFGRNENQIHHAERHLKADGYTSS